MIVREFSPEEKNLYNDFVADSPTSHVIQSWQWGDFRAGIGTPVLRFGVFEDAKLLATAQLTLHRIPRTGYHVGYLPKGPVVSGDPVLVLPTLVEGVRKIVDKYDLVFVKVEPNVLASSKDWEMALTNSGFKKSAKRIFTEWNFLLDLTQPEEEILKRMQGKWRYNIRLAERKGVTVTEEDSGDALEAFLALHRETAKRQKFLLHEDNYYREVWRRLHPQGMAKLLLAHQGGKVLAAWLVLIFGKKIYYPYGASSSTGREVMPVHALAWKTVQLGKALGCETFDMWGAADPEEGEKSFIWGSHTFKQGFGPELVHYLGTYDLVFNQKWYRIFTTLYPVAIRIISWLR